MPSRRTLLKTGGAVALTATALGTGSTAAYAGTRRWSWLESRLRGDLVLPGDARYDLAKQIQIAAYDAVNPQGIAYCETAEDVSNSIRFARHHEIPVRIRSGGHNQSGWSTGEGLVVDLSRINQVDVGRQTIHVGPGNEAIEVVNKLRPAGKQVVSGTCATVCLGGFLSGGGIGYHTRKFGVGSDRVVSAKLVLADGRVVRCSPAEHPDLYWAIRGGGGGNFGVVVDFEVRPIDQPTAVNYTTMWPADRMADAFTQWQRWCVDGPNSLGSLFVVSPPYGGQPAVLVTGMYLGPKQELEALLDQLAERIGAQPLSRTVSEQLPYAEAAHTNYCGDKTLEQCQRVGHNPDAVMPRTPYQTQSYQLIDRALTPAEVADYLAAWDTRGDELQHRYLQCMAIGGVANEIGRDSSAWWHRDARFLIGYLVGQDSPTPAPDKIAAAQEWADAGAAVLARFASGSYINFPSSRPVDDWQHSTWGGHYERLVRIKRAYDPQNFFRYAQSIGS